MGLFNHRTWWAILGWMHQRQAVRAVHRQDHSLRHDPADGAGFQIHQHQHLLAGYVFGFVMLSDTCHKFSLFAADSTFRRSSLLVLGTGAASSTVATRRSSRVKSS